jgi:hypothetical protein
MLIWSELIIGISIVLAVKTLNANKCYRYRIFSGVKHQKTGQNFSEEIY